MEETIINQARLCGIMDSAPSFSHENHGRRFYRFVLAVERLSGTVDRLNVLTDWELLDAADLCPGEWVAVTGQVRSYNEVTPTGRHLRISVYAEDLDGLCERADNRIELTGVLCKDPVYRRTPLGREICDVMLAVNRPYHRTDYVPCIFWGRTARTVALCSVGDRLHLTGRLQSREYVKTLADGTTTRRTAFEVSAITAETVETPAYEPEISAL